MSEAPSDSIMYCTVCACHGKFIITVLYSFMDRNVFRDLIYVNCLVELGERMCAKRNDIKFNITFGIRNAAICLIV